MRTSTSAQSSASAAELSESFAGRVGFDLYPAQRKASLMRVSPMRRRRKAHAQGPIHDTRISPRRPRESKRAPRRALRDSQIDPWCDSTIDLAIDSPIPIPLVLVV